MSVRRVILTASAFAAALIAFTVASCGEAEDEDEDDGATSATSTEGGGGATTSSAAAGAGGGGGPIIVADCRDGWCRIPAGKFVIGSPEDECGHPPSSETQVEVTLSQSFLIGQNEVTQAEWQALGLTDPSTEIQNNPDDKGNCIAADCPVGNINWFEAAAFSNLLSEAEGLAPCYELAGCTGQPGEDMECTGLTLTAPSAYDCTGYRLPTEAEWEHAARAGTTTPIYSGEIQPCDLSACYPDANLDAIGWVCLNAGAQTHPVGQRQPNGWGLHDMIGNVFEWTHGDFTPSGYGDGPLVDPGGEPGPVTPTTARTLRGCGYFAWNSLCRAAERSSAPMHGRFPGWGFRLARTLAD